MSDVLQQAEDAFVKSDFSGAAQFYRNLLQGSHAECAQGHLGLARVCFATNEDAQGHLLAAMRAAGRAKEYGLCEKAIGLCKQHSPSAVPILLEESILLFPHNPQSYVELITHYQVTQALSPQRKLLSQMATQTHTLNGEEKKHFTMVMNKLAEEYFFLAKDEKDKWLWSFEREHWLKVQSPYRLTLVLTAYLAPDILSGHYCVTPMTITRYNDTIYMFEANDLYVECIRNPQADTFCTHGQTIEDYVEDAMYTYYNDIIFQHYKNELIQYIQLHNNFDSEKFATFMKQQGKIN